MKLVSRIHKYVHWVTVTDNHFIWKKLSIFGFKIPFNKKPSTAPFFNSHFDITTFPKAKGLHRKLQLSNALLLEIFDLICHHNGICYYVDYGTLMGAVRHKGFIPWDDDIDVTIPKEHVEPLIEILRRELNGTGLFVYGVDNMRLGCNTLRITMRSFETVNLDIFYPYAFDINPYSNDEYLRIKKIWQKHKWEYLFEIWEMEKRPDKCDYTTFRNLTDSNFEKEVGSACNLLSNRAKLMCLPISNQKPYVERVSDVFPLGTVTFEGKNYPAPKSTDSYLREIYGDYMSFPPSFDYHGDAFSDFTEAEVDAAIKYLEGIKTSLIAKYSTSA